MGAGGVCSILSNSRINTPPSGPQRSSDFRRARESHHHICYVRCQCARVCMCVMLSELYIVIKRRSTYARSFIFATTLREPRVCVPYTNHMFPCEGEQGRAHARKRGRGVQQYYTIYPLSRSLTRSFDLHSLTRPITVHQPPNCVVAIHHMGHAVPLHWQCPPSPLPAVERACAYTYVSANRIMYTNCDDCAKQTSRAPT